MGIVYEHYFTIDEIMPRAYCYVCFACSGIYNDIDSKRISSAIYTNTCKIGVIQWLLLHIVGGSKQSGPSKNANQ